MRVLRELRKGRLVDCTSLMRVCSCVRASVRLCMCAAVQAVLRGVVFRQLVVRPRRYIVRASLRLPEKLSGTGKSGCGELESLEGQKRVSFDRSNDTHISEKRTKYTSDFRHIEHVAGEHRGVKGRY